MKKKWKIILGSIAALILVGITASQFFMGETVEVKEIKPEDIRKSFTEDGIVVSPEERTVHPLTGARILELKVEEGDQVQKGDLLAILEDDEIQYQLEEIQARLRQLEGEERELHEDPGDAEMESQEIAIEQAKKNQAAIERDYERTKFLYEEGAVPEAELDKAEDLLEDAAHHLQQQKAALEALREAHHPTRGKKEILEAQKEAALAQKDLIKHQLDNYQIHAPLSGKVINLTAKEGELASPEKPLMELFDPESHEVETRVLTQDIHDIYQGMTVGLTLEKREDDLEFTGEVIEIAPKAEGSVSELGLDEKRVKVTVLPDLPEEVNMGPGYDLEVEFISMELSDKFIVPQRAIFTDHGKDALFIAENGTAKVRQVTTGLETDNRVVIDEGLSKGDLVIVEHDLENIREGSRVNPFILE